MPGRCRGSAAQWHAAAEDVQTPQGVRFTPCLYAKLRVKQVEDLLVGNDVFMAAQALTVNKGRVNETAVAAFAAHFVASEYFPNE